MDDRTTRPFGCAATTSAVLAVILVVSLGVWALISLKGGSLEASFGTHRPVVPTTIPPAPGPQPPTIDINAPGRTADALTDWAAPIATATHIPPAALRAYANAQQIANLSHPNCHLSWTTLAGIGFVETRHGSYSGKFLSPSHIGPDGIVTPTITGVPLDGSPGFAAIADTDGGKLDGDTTWDRAVGPLQFLPSTWNFIGADANGDGVKDPNQIDDAALGAARLLCLGNRDLATASGWEDAVFSYNRSKKYRDDVRDAAAAYALDEPAD